ncbi:class I SAM-dependent methyltransferase [Weissella diestrammenae]|uniref:Class I SAM-dependent methyltransferase n=1 Tax=Weissella diestrammenae TaxID=1162633 RepID=A0A7G9T6Q1_9LACO|nr:class I SAM-dependent methyltransferase [Weissella diestrammenae]MCM0582938.1 class I SAM-dependent methyltransferase [Weissella diestrammenae]QNN75776.1 class I SAM-dependent methyltransferase [Weissella diestrammenae]
MTEEHYYTQNPTTEHDEQTWSFSLLNHTLQFTTDAGVFSKQTVDFGTRTMLEAFNTEQLPAGKILDLGAGYGPVAISLAKALPKRQIDAVEVNERALALTLRNAADNQVAEQITGIQSDRYQQVHDKYAAILTNPPVRAGKSVVNDMITGAAEHLVANGTLTVVLQKKQGAPSAKQLMAETFGNVAVIAKNKGYYILESIYHDTSAN